MPHWEQRTSPEREAPQPPQKVAPSRFRCPQAGQSTGVPRGFGSQEPDCTSARRSSHRSGELLDQCPPLSPITLNVHGGVIMRMVDEAAAIVAMKHSHRQVVTARVERFDFWKPAYLGDVVTVECALEFVGRTSMEVGVTVTAEDPISREVRTVASSHVIYVAIDEHGRPTPVPLLAPADQEEERTVEQARLRRERASD